MRQFGLIGYPLSHSFSQKYFTQKFEQEGITDSNYNLYPIEEIAQIEELITRIKPEGLTVTTPYKLAVMDHIDRLDATAEAVGAVNTIHFTDKRTGYNTDVDGFRLSAEKWLKGAKPQALILGSGGAALAVKYALDQLDITANFVSRSPGEGQIAYTDLNPETIQANQLIINATPLGMYPDVNSLAQLPYEALGTEHFLYDLSYNPEVSSFLQKGITAGAQTKNGLEMLHLQAEKAWEIWNA